MTTLALHDSRRLTGPNLITDSAGAVLDVTLGPHEPERVVRIWREQAQRILASVDWHNEEIHARTFPGGASLVMTAPIDALYAATEVNEWAWAAAEAELEGGSEPDLTEAAERLRGLIAEERNPALIALKKAAHARSVCFLSDDDRASVGMGRGSLTWPVDSLPRPDEVDWKSVHDVPVALVTGSNGKTTTVRLVAAIARAAGFTPGYCSTDGIFVGGALVDAGDWSGPGGARWVLRDKEVDVAVLETARGGVLRRGLGVRRADAAIVTNVAADHLGEWGVHDVEAIAQAKLVVGRAVGRGGKLIVNADDPVLARRATALDVPLTWFTMEPTAPHIATFVAEGVDMCVVEDGAFVLIQKGHRHRAGDGRRIREGRRQVVAEVSEVPITFGGAAGYNIYNVLGAIPVATALGLSMEPIRSGLLTFGRTPADNPGRSNLFELGGVKILVDFAHNPHGMQALGATAVALPAKRRLLILGQAGDRDDESIRELARAAWAIHPDRIIVKEMRKYLRGRPEGEVPALIVEELTRRGATPEAIARADS